MMEENMNLLLTHSFASFRHEQHAAARTNLQTVAVRWSFGHRLSSV
jgi:hypothetical protein